MSSHSSHSNENGSAAAVDISRENDHGKPPVEKENDSHSTSVSPFTSGEGLPYAPVDWPTQGDVWSWKVGRRINKRGFFADRFLIPPECLRTPEMRKQGFGGKSTVENFIRTEFSSADVDPFFASFSWEIPAKFQYRTQADSKKAKKTNLGEHTEEATHSVRRKRKRKSENFVSCPQKISPMETEKAKESDRAGERIKEASHPTPSKRRKGSHVVSSELKFYTRRRKFCRLVMSETTKQVNQREQIEEASCPILRGRKQKQSSMFPARNQRIPRDPPNPTTLDDIVIIENLSGESDSINQDMRTITNTESNQMPIHSINSVEDANHKTSVEAKSSQRTLQDPQLSTTPDDIAIFEDSNGESNNVNQDPGTTTNTESNQISSYNINSLEDANYKTSVEAISNQQTLQDPPCPTTPDDIVISEDLSGESDNINQDMRTTTNIESNQISGHNINSLEDYNRKTSTEAISGDFESYINSLEEILTQPLSQGMSSAVTDVLTLGKASAQLSSLLAVDFSVFVSTGSHTELADLLGKLHNNPSLGSDQLVKLMPLEAIPLLRMHFLEDIKIKEEASNFFEDLEINLAKANSCKERYNESKEKIAQFQEVIDSSSLAMQNIDEQIARLKLQKDELVDTVSYTTKLKDELNLKQKEVEVILPELVSKIQMANSKKMEWEMKKLKANERQGQILATYASLQQITL